MSTVLVESPRGHPVRAVVRDDTSDLSHIGSCMRLWGSLDDEYRLADLKVSGVAIDIGAHVGAVTMSLLADNPDLRVIALEPLRENCDLIRATLAENGWTDRCLIIEGAASSSKTVDVRFNYTGDYGRTNRYVGNLAGEDAQSIVTVPGYTLGHLVELAGGSIDLIVIDCEGCEWELFTDRDSLAKVERVIGEWHGDPQGPGIEALFAETHDVTLKPVGATGNFWAVRR